MNHSGTPVVFSYDLSPVACDSHGPRELSTLLQAYILNTKLSTKKWLRLIIFFPLALAEELPMRNVNDLTMTVLKATASQFCHCGIYANHQWVAVWVENVC